MDATCENKPELVRLLLEKGVHPNKSYVWGNFPLDAAVCLCFPDVVRILLDHGAILNVRPYDYPRLKYQASHRGSRAVLNELVERDVYPMNAHEKRLAFSYIDHYEKVAGI